MIIEQRFGRAGYEQAVRESRFFFSDEVAAGVEWQFASNGAAIRQPVLVVEGGDGRHNGLLSQQVTDVTTTLLPQAEVVLIPGSNHMVPLQEPVALGEALANFARMHPIGSVGRMTRPACVEPVGIRTAETPSAIIERVPANLL